MRGVSWCCVLGLALAVVFGEGVAGASPLLGPERFVSKPFYVPGSETAAVASNGTVGFAAWIETPLAEPPPVVPGSLGTVVVGTRLGADGRPLDPAGIVIARTDADYSSGVAIGSDGSGFVVLWVELGPDLRGVLRAVRLDGSGVVRDATPITVTSEGPLGSLFAPPQFDVTGIGGEYAVVWGSRDGKFLRRIGTDGALMGAESVLLSSTPGSPPQLAANADEYLVSWTEPTGIVATRFSKTGSVLGTPGFAVATGSLAISDVASNGSDFLVVASNPGGDILGARVTSTGVAQDPSGFPIAAGERSRSGAQVAGGGSGYYVMWEDRAKGAGSSSAALVNGARVSAQGTVTGQPTTFDTAFYPVPEVVRLGAGFFAKYTFGSVLGTRVTTAGVLLDQPRNNVTVSREPETTTAIATNGSSYLVLENQQSESRLRSDAVVLESSAITLASKRGYPTALASNGSDYLAAWVDFDGQGATRRAFKAVRTFADGHVESAGGKTLFEQTGSYYFPPRAALAGTASQYLLAWCDGQDQPDHDIHGIRLDPSGTPLGAAFSIASTNVSDCPELVVGTDGHDFLVVFRGYDSATDSVPFRAVRVRADGAVLDDPPNIVAPSEAWWPPSSISFAAGEYLLVYAGMATIAQKPVYTPRALRISAAGVAKGAPFSLAPPSSNLSNPTAASDGFDHVVTWGDYRSRANSVATGVRVRGGTSSVEPFAISEPPEYPDSPTPCCRATGVFTAAAARGEFVAVYPRYVDATRGLQRVARTVRFDVPPPDGGAPDGSTSTGGASGSLDAGMHDDGSDGLPPPYNDASVPGSSGGATASGGAPSSSGGRANPGGTTSADGGTSPDGGTTPVPGDDGCDCRAVASRPRPDPASLLAAIGALAAVIRRLRPANRSTPTDRRT